MYFCDDCGTMITPQNGSGEYENCGAEYKIEELELFNADKD